MELTPKHALALISNYAGQLRLQASLMAAHNVSKLTVHYERLVAAGSPIGALAVPKEWCDIFRFVGATSCDAIGQDAAGHSQFKVLHKTRASSISNFANLSRELQCKERFARSEKAMIRAVATRSPQMRASKQQAVADFLSYQRPPAAASKDTLATFACAFLHQSQP